MKVRSNSMLPSAQSARRGAPNERVKYEGNICSLLKSPGDLLSCCLRLPGCCSLTATWYSQCVCAWYCNAIGTVLWLLQLTVLSHRIKEFWKIHFSSKLPTCWLTVGMLHIRLSRRKQFAKIFHNSTHYWWQQTGGVLHVRGARQSHDSLTTVHSPHQTTNKLSSFFQKSNSNTSKIPLPLRWPGLTQQHQQPSHWTKDESGGLDVDWAGGEGQKGGEGPRQGSEGPRQRREGSRQAREGLRQGIEGPRQGREGLRQGIEGGRKSRSPLARERRPGPDHYDRPTELILSPNSYQQQMSLPVPLDFTRSKKSAMQNIRGSFLTRNKSDKVNDVH